MLRPSHVLALWFFFYIQSSWSESMDVEVELDEEFLEILGSFEAEEDDWYDFFWSTIDETQQESTTDVGNE